MRTNHILVLWSLLVMCAIPRGAAAQPAKPWLGLHVITESADEADKLIKIIPSLAKVGVNVLIVEVGYNFQFESHPELRGKNDITKAQAKTIGDLCRANGIRPIPEFNCLGHQSWAKTTHQLLKAHPEFDETPNKFPDNQGSYCRSWCPSNPDVYKTIFELMDELTAAFAADGFHAGMDEVFIIADKDCPRCKGKDPAELYAKAVNAIHDHLASRKVQMLMWGDRLLDAKAMGYSKWEASANGTAPAIDMIPRDIIICDWHYEPMAYPSIKFLLDKGFQVWPTGWHNTAAAEKLIDEGLSQKNDRMLGYLSSTWLKIPIEQIPDFEPTKLAARKLGIAK